MSKVASDLKPYTLSLDYNDRFNNCRWEVTLTVLNMLEIKYEFTEYAINKLRTNINNDEFIVEGTDLIFHKNKGDNMVEVYKFDTFRVQRLYNRLNIEELKYIFNKVNLYFNSCKTDINNENF